MLSSELPVTEYWDPEDGAWQVQPWPDYRISIDLWFAAMDHETTIDWIWYGETSYWGPFHGRQLTTGHYRDCRTYDGGLCDGTCTIANHHPPRPRPVELYGQASHCMCRYGLRYVPDAPGPRFPIDPFGRYTREWGVWAFRVHPKCPHHGDHR